MTCNNCGAEVQDGMKFCFDCGTPVPQVKKCVSCGAELALKMKFCPECGTNQDGSTPKSSGFSMGDKNVIAGDVIGSKEETHISGNATIIKNEDQTKQVKKCHICGSFIPVVDGYDCPECGEFTCEDCFDSKYRVCNSCVSLALKKNEEKYKDALEKALEDGTISITERKELKELQTKYGITDQKAKQLEEIVKFGQPQTETNFTTMEKINFEKATELFYEYGKVEEAYNLLEPIYKAHPYEEKVLDIYLPVLVKKDIEAAKKIIKELNVDMLSIYLASIDIAFVENNLSEAERIINKGKQIWKDSSILQGYEAILYIKFAQTTKDKSFLKTAEEIANNFPESKDKLELSYQVKTLLELQKEKGEDTSYYTKAFCKENNLYTSLFDFKVIIIKVGKNQGIKTLKEALEKLYENGTIILEPGVYKEHVNFDKKVKIVGATDSIMNKSSSELPIVVLDSTKSCEISAPVEIEGVVFTHEKNLSFNNLQNYAEEEYDFDDEVIESKNYGDDDFASCLLVNSDAKLKNVAILDSLTYGITLAKTKGTIEDSIISHCYDNCLYCVEKTEATVQKTKIINSRYPGVNACETSNPSLKACEIYGHLASGIWVKDQAKGTYTNCHIHDNQSDGLIIEGSSTPSFVDCKIHDNKINPAEDDGSGVCARETSNPSFKDCEIYGSTEVGLWVKDQASGTYTNCHIHDNQNNGLIIGGSSTPSFEDCKIHDNKKEGRPGVVVIESSNPSIKECEIYGLLSGGIWVKDQASGTYTNCHIYDNLGNGLVIGGSSTPSFEDCKIHDNKNKKEDNPGVVVFNSSNPSLKACEIYGHLASGIWVKDQASGTYTNCHIHDNYVGLYIEGSSTPSFEDCKIHDNKKGAMDCPGVVVIHSSNPSLKDCEIYGHLSSGIRVKDQAKGTYKNCYIHNNIGVNFNNKTSNTIDTSTCRME